MASPTEVVARLYAVLEASDRSEYGTVLDPDVEWEFMLGFPHGGPRRGLAAVLDETFTPLMEDFDEWHIEVDEIIPADGGAVIGLGRYRGRAAATRREVVAPFCHVFRLRDGLVVRVQQFTDTLQLARVLGND